MAYGKAVLMHILLQIAICTLKMTCNVNFDVFIQLCDHKNIHFDPKIMIVKLIQPELQKSQNIGVVSGHLGRHLGFQKSQAFCDFPPSLKFMS